jgi:hypothetical protein
MLRRVLLVRTDVSEELSASIIRVVVAANFVLSSPILVALMMKALSSSKHWFLQEPHCVTSLKMPFFIVTAVKTSNVTQRNTVLVNNRTGRQRAVAIKLRMVRTKLQSIVIQVSSNGSVKMDL